MLTVCCFKHPEIHITKERFYNGMSYGGITKRWSHSLHVDWSCRNHHSIQLSPNQSSSLWDPCFCFPSYFPHCSISLSQTAKALPSSSMNTSATSKMHELLLFHPLLDGREGAEAAMSQLHTQLPTVSHLSIYSLQALAKTCLISSQNGTLTVFLS